MTSLLPVHWLHGHRVAKDTIFTLRVHLPSETFSVSCGRSPTRSHMHLPSAGEILLRKKRVRRNALLLNSFDSARIHSGLTANEEGQVRIGIKDELTIFSQLCGVLLLLLEELHVHRANTPALCGVYELEVETVTRLVGGDPTTSDILPALFERRMSTGRGRPGTNLTNIHEIMFRFVLCE